MPLSKHNNDVPVVIDEIDEGKINKEHLDPGNHSSLLVEEEAKLQDRDQSPLVSAQREDIDKPLEFYPHSFDDSALDFKE